MRFNVVALALSVGLICGAAMLIVGLANLVSPSYGRAFLDAVASVYPGFHPASGIGSVIVGALYGFIDGAIGGAIFAWLYNGLARPRRGGPQEPVDATAGSATRRATDGR